MTIALLGLLAGCEELDLTLLYDSYEYHPPSSTRRPIRNARLELTVDGHAYSGSTDSAGRFKLDAASPPPWTLVADVYSQSQFGSYDIVVGEPDAKGAPSADAPYRFSLTVSSSPVELTVPRLASGETVGAESFALLDDAQGAVDYLERLEPGLHKEPIRVLFPHGDPDVAATNPTAAGAGQVGTLLMGINRVWGDAFRHELGHWAHAIHAGPTTSGVAHRTDDVIAPESAFGEGWATYFAAVLAQHQGRATPWQFVRVDRDAIKYLVDLETTERFEGGLAKGVASPRSQSNETAVAAALWDLVDGAGANEAWDTLHDEEVLVWRALRALAGASANGPTFDRWFLALRQLDLAVASAAAGTWQHQRGPANVDSLLGALGMHFFADRFEPNQDCIDSPRLYEGVDFGPGIAPLELTLFRQDMDPTGDEDWFLIFPTDRSVNATPVVRLEPIYLSDSESRTAGNFGLDGGARLVVELSGGPCEGITVASAPGEIPVQVEYPYGTGMVGLRVRFADPTAPIKLAQYRLHIEYR